MNGYLHMTFLIIHYWLTKSLENLNKLLQKLSGTGRQYTKGWKTNKRYLKSYGACTSNDSTNIYASYLFSTHPNTLGMSNFQWRITSRCIWATKEILTVLEILNVSSLQFIEIQNNNNNLFYIFNNYKCQLLIQYCWRAVTCHNSYSCHQRCIYQSIW